MRRKRLLVLSTVLIFASFVVISAQKIFIYAAAPGAEKESDFVFPPNADQGKPTRISLPKAPPVIFHQLGGFTNDASHLNRTAIYGVVKVIDEGSIRKALQFARENKLKITCIGQQHSMGGQSFTHDGLLLDMKGFNRIQLDKEHRIVNVQAGVRWWQLQELLDKEGLAVKSMQSINIFSIGGSLSVNGHGIDPAPGPIAPSVRAMRVMLSNGEIVKASPTENADLFRHVLGGYGLFGVILDGSGCGGERDVLPPSALHGLQRLSRILPNAYRRQRQDWAGVWTIVGCSAIISARDCVSSPDSSRTA